MTLITCCFYIKIPNNLWEYPNTIHKHLYDWSHFWVSSILYVLQFFVLHRFLIIVISN